MVFFTCNHCGGASKKPAVAKHYASKCRGLPVSVTCMDCQQDFRGEEYTKHNKCISEHEKYSAKDSVQKPGLNKGQRKQDLWIDTINSISEDQDVKMDQRLRYVFQRLQTYDNIPRKKIKFQKFVNNSFKIPMNTAMEVWNILEKALEKFKKSNENGQNQVNGKSETKNEQDSKKSEVSENQIESELNDKVNSGEGDASVIEMGDLENGKSLKKKKKNKTEICLNEEKDEAENPTSNGFKKNKKRNLEEGNASEINTEDLENENSLKKKKKNKTEDCLNGEKDEDEKPTSNEFKKNKKRNLEEGNASEINTEDLENENSLKKKKKKNKTEDCLNGEKDEDEKPASNEFKKNKKRNLFESTNGVEIHENESSPSKKKKQKNEDNSIELKNNDENQKFDWISIIGECVADGMNAAKLKKKVFKKYSKQNPDIEISNKIEKTFKKYLKKSGFLIEDDTIKQIIQM